MHIEYFKIFNIFIFLIILLKFKILNFIKIIYLNINTNLLYITKKLIYYKKDINIYTLNCYQNYKARKSFMKMYLNHVKKNLKK